MFSKATSKNRAAGEKGQAIIVAILLVVIMVIMVPFLANFLRLHSGWGVSAAQSSMALRAAYAGVAQASNWLSADQTQALWDNARGNNTAFTGTWPSSLNHGGVANSGGTFSLQLNTNLDTNAMGLGLPPRFLTEICSTGHYEGVTRALQVGLKARGIGVRLPNGLEIYPALTLLHDPLPGSVAGLSVYWGPIVVYDNFTLLPTDEIYSTHSPRKFAVGAIYPDKPTSMAPTTDGKEYWAYSKLGAPPVIDTPKYQAQSGLTPTTLDGPAPYGYIPVPVGTTSLYIAGDAMLNRVQVTVKGLIVTGNATFDTNVVKANYPSMCGAFDCDTVMNAPIEFWREYPQGFNALPFPGWTLSSGINPHCVTPGDPAYPCNVGNLSAGIYQFSTTLGIGGIATNQVADIHGFVYVKGNLNVTHGDWIINGGLRVDGTLTIDPLHAHLYVLANDFVLNNVYTTPLKIEPAYIREIPPGQFHPTAL
jgi:hypothetical protein